MIRNFIRRFQGYKKRSYLENLVKNRMRWEKTFKLKEIFFSTRLIVS